jgi:hypothetical protein
MTGIAEIGLIYSTVKFAGALALSGTVSSNCAFTDDKANCEIVTPSLEYQAIQRYANEEVIILDINLSVYGEPHWINKRFHAHGCRFGSDAKDGDQVVVRVYKGLWCNDISLTKRTESNGVGNTERSTSNEN